MPRLSSTDKELGHELGALDSLPGPSSSRAMASLALPSPASGNQLSTTQSTQVEHLPPPAPRYASLIATAQMHW